MEQVARTNPTTWREVEELFRKCDNGAVPPRTALLHSTLFAILLRSPGIYAILDGLDECSETEREMLLKLVADIMSDGRLDTHILVTSRGDRSVERAMRKLNATNVRVSGREIAADINLHVRESLAKDMRLSKFPRDVKDEIENVLTEKANGMSVHEVSRLVPLRSYLGIC